MSDASPSSLRVVKPFLMLGTRGEDEAALGEAATVAAIGELDGDSLVHHRLERDPLPPGDLRAFLEEFAGVIVGGGPFNVSDPPGEKSAVQARAESDLARLLDAVVAEDRPFLGLCYGVGLLGSHQGGLVDRTYGEPVSSVTVSRTDAGVRDPLFAPGPASFPAYVGHKEALTVAPSTATVLASSPTCPVQAFRVRDNVYATQFHPELTADALCVRIDIYKAYGYFDPGDVGELKAAARAVDVSDSNGVLTRFVERYRD